VGIKGHSDTHLSSFPPFLPPSLPSSLPPSLQFLHYLSAFCVYLLAFLHLPATIEGTSPPPSLPPFLPPSFLPSFLPSLLVLTTVPASSSPSK